MRQWLKKSVRVVLILTVLAVIIAFLQTIVLTRFVRSLILSRLADIGLPEASLKVRSCSFRSAELTDVELGNERCACIGALTAEYSLYSLFRGKVNRVLVTGGQLTLRIRDGKIEFGELAQIAVKGGQQARGSSFDSIDLRACTLSIHWPQKQICIPCEGTIRDNGAGWIVHDLRLNFQGTPLRLKATLYTRGETLAFSFDRQDIDLRDLMAALPVESVSIPARLAGMTGLRLQGEISTSGSGGLLRASLRDAWFKTTLAGSPLDAEGVAGEFEIRLESLSELKKIVAKLSAEAVEFAGVRASAVQLDVENISDELMLSGEARGQEWHLRSFTATLPSAWRSNNTQKNRADAAWAFEGTLPEPIAHKLFADGIDISELGAMNVAGHLSTTLSQTPDLDLSRLRVALSPGTLSIGQGSFVLKGLSGILTFKGHYSQDEARLQLLSDTTLNIDSARFKDITFGKTSLKLKAIDDRDIAKVIFEERGVTTRLNLDAGTDSLNVRTAGNALMAKLGGIQLSLDATLSPKLDQASGLLTVDTLRFHPGYRGLYLDLQNAALSVASKPGGDTGTALESTLTLAKAALLNDKSDVLFAADQQGIKPITGSFDLTQLRGEFKSDRFIDREATLSIQGNLDLSERQPSGSITAVCREVHLDSEHPAVKMLAAPTGIVTRGDLSWEADLRWRAGYFTPKIKAFITDASFSSNVHKVKAEGINGSIVFTSLSPISTPGNQMLTVKRFMLGEAEFADGYVVFRLEEDPAAVFIERTVWGWMGGRLHAQAVRIDPNLPRVDFRLFAEGLALRELLDTAFGEGATGRGELYGMIPVSLSLSDLADLRLGEGFLHSTSRDGWWKLAGDTPQRPAWKAVEKQLKRASEGGGRTAGTGLLSKALLDFEYDRFKIDFVAEQGGLTARIVTKGRSRNKQAPVEFERITLNIPRFDENLRQMLAIKSAIDTNLKQAGKEIQQ